MNGLQESESLALIRQWFDAMPHGLILVGPSGEILYVNKQILWLFGYSGDELLGQTIEILIPQRFSHGHAGFRDHFFAHREQRLMGAGRDLFAIRKDGSEFPVEVGLGPIDFSGTRGVLCSIVDITERKKAQNELDIRSDKIASLYRVSELLRTGELNASVLQQVADATRAGLVHTPVAGIRVTLDGKSFQDKDCRVTEHAISVEIDVQGKLRGAIEGFYTPNALEGDPEAFLERKGLFIGAVAKMMSDVVERIEAGAKVIHSSKLAAVGELAAGVGHEINNPINGIMNCADLLLKDAPKDSKQEKYLQMICKESERVARIVASLLAFSRQDKETHSLARVYDIVQKVMDFTRKRIEKSHILLHLDVPEDLPKILCRTEQLQQVVLNLIINSIHALDDRFAGSDPEKTLAITGSTVALDDRPFIKLLFEDRGCGIPTENKNRIFEPFFSTKGKDKGTGLGLAVSDGIVKSHGGSILVESELMAYTRITILLPVPDNARDAGGR